MEYLYVLKLEKSKWYVGKTSDVMKRYQQHVDGKGSAWTTKYSPISLVESKPISSHHDENNVTKDYMKKYGVDNVRGGSYTQIKLDDSVISVLNAEFLGNTDKCFNCGLAGHFADKCKKPEKPKYIAKIQWQNYSQLEEADNNACFRCGRNSHWQVDCYARTDIDGDLIED